MDAQGTADSEGHGGKRMDDDEPVSRVFREAIDNRGEPYHSVKYGYSLLTIVCVMFAIQTCNPGTCIYLKHGTSQYREHNRYFWGQRSSQAGRSRWHRGDQEDLPSRMIEHIISLCYYVEYRWLGHSMTKLPSVFYTVSRGLLAYYGRSACSSPSIRQIDTHLCKLIWQCCQS